MSNVIKDLMITLRVYKGKEHYDIEGNLSSESQTFKLEYARLSWKIFLKTVNQLNYSKVEAIKCMDVTKRNNQHEVEIPDSVHEDIKKAMGAVEKPLTPEQKEIKELKAQMAKLLDSKKEKKKVIQPKGESGNLDELRAEYLKVVGKKAHHMLGEAKLKEAIANAKNS